MEGDNSALLKSLEDVNAKYKESSKDLEKQKIALQTLIDREAELMKGRERANNPTIIAKYNAKLQENKEKIDQVKTAINNLAASETKAGKTTDDLNKKIKDAFDATKVAAARAEVENLGKKIADVEKPTQSLKAQLRALKAQLAETDDDKEFTRLSVEAGKLEDKIQDAQQAARIFATDSPFQAVGNSIRGVAGDLLSMDFAGAAQKSKLLVDATKQITFKQSIAGLKDLGTTLLNVGKSLLLNPIFLIGAAVSLIIANFDTLRTSGGLVGKVFTFIGDSVTGLIKVFTDLTDLIGLTDIAAQKAAKSMQKSFQETLDMGLQAVTNRYNAEIAKAQAAGKEVNRIEIEKRQALIETYEDAIKGQFALVDSSEASIQRALAFEKTARIQIGSLTREIELIRLEDEKKALDKERELRASRLKEMEEFLRKRAELDAELELNNLKADQDARDKETEQAKAQIEEEQRIEQIEYDFLEAQQKKRIKLAYDEMTEKLAIRAKEEADRKERQEKEKEALISLVNTSIQASQQIISAKLAENSRLTSAQQRRVDQAKELAEKGNSQLLELEEKRLADLNRQRELFVQRQQALATVELIANTAIAVSKAAAQGGVAAAITIAAALIALTGGLIAGRSIASQAAYYEGGEFDGQGYTGDGNPRSESMGVGRKPYKYHMKEFIFNHQTTAKYGDIFKAIHEGQIDLNDWRHKVMAYEAMKMMPSGGSNQMDVDRLDKKLSTLIMVIENQSTSVNMDAEGLSMHFKGIKTRNDYVKNHLARI